MKAKKSTPEPLKASSPKKKMPPSTTLTVIGYVAEYCRRRQMVPTTYEIGGVRYSL